MEVRRAAPVGGVGEHLGDGAGHGGGLVAGEHANAIYSPRPLGLGILSVTRPEVVVRPRSQRPAFTRSSASSRRAFRASSAVWRTSSLGSPRTAASSNVTMGTDMALPPGMIEFDTQIIPRAGAVSFWYLGYAAVKVRKKLYVTRSRESACLM